MRVRSFCRHRHTLLTHAHHYTVLPSFRFQFAGWLSDSTLNIFPTGDSSGTVGDSLYAQACSVGLGGLPPPHPEPLAASPEDKAGRADEGVGVPRDEVAAAKRTAARTAPTDGAFLLLGGATMPSST
eukprot:1181095-Prorocentrum_minimum.AAC.1